MLVDVHAHYVPLSIVEALRTHGLDYGVSIATTQPPACAECLRFEYGLVARPFFAQLVEAPGERLDGMRRQGITRQVLSLWTDIFGYGLPSAKGGAWHRLLNRSMAQWCSRHPQSFSWLASGALPDASSAARELERCVREEGAVGGVVAANVDGVNLGELELDEYWAAAAQLGVPVFIHPQAEPTPRTRNFALNPIAQYTFDTTLAIGSLIGSGVLDRFPSLQLIASHGGGSFPYLAGRFDCLFSRMDASATRNVAREAPSAYLRRLYYDTILHNDRALRFLADCVGVDRMVIGTDYSFPPADHDPLKSLRSAGFSREDISTIGEVNPKRLFSL